jgi:hypothetical protein
MKRGIFLVDNPENLYDEVIVIEMKSVKIFVATVFIVATYFAGS